MTSGELDMYCDIDFTPVVGRCLAGGIVDYAGDIGLEGIGAGALEHREPGDIVDQLLFRVLVESQAVSSQVAVPCCQFLLDRLLSAGAGAEVLTVVREIVGCSLTELERGPILRIRIVRAPGEGPHLQALILAFAQIGLSAGRISQRLQQIVKALHLNCYIHAEHLPPLLAQSSNLIVQQWRVAFIGNLDWGKDRQRGIFFLQALLKERSGFGRIALCGGVIRAGELYIVTRDALGNNMAGGRIQALNWWNSLPLASTCASFSGGILDSSSESP